MKKNKCLPLALVAIVCLCNLLSCVKDSGTTTYSIYTPIYKTTAQIRSEISSVAAQNIASIGKIYQIGNYLLMNELYKGVHILDISNPSNPRNVAFISIPGNEDIAVIGNILYADCYTDLMVIDIQNPLQSKLQTYIPNIFPDRRYINGFYADSGKIAVDWTKRDTTIETQSSSSFFKNNQFYTTDAALNFSNNASVASNNTTGQGGSMARFAIVNPFLYTVTTTKLNVVNIVQPKAPTWNKTVDLGFGIETIFPYQNQLFIGTTTGIQIFSTSNPDAPSKVGQFAHATQCDPVIFDGKYAFVTLRSGTACRGMSNQLDVLDASNPANTTLLKTYTLSNPHGLTKDGNALFICDGDAGLKYFDASDPLNISLKTTIDIKKTYDVIHHNQLLFVSAGDGLYIYDYSQLNNIQLKSKVLLSNL